MSKYRLAIVAALLALVTMFAVTQGAWAQDSPSPAGDAAGAAGCEVKSNVNYLRIRSGPSTDSTAHGQLQAGQTLPADCESVWGGYYDSCGGGSEWIPVYYRGQQAYVAAWCVDWYYTAAAAEDTSDEGAEVPPEGVGVG